MILIESIFVFIVGAIVGSFLNVCIWRLPKEESVWSPASYCPKCRQPIRWYDNVPILSFFALKGRCRDCKSMISWRYPVIEFATAVVFLALFALFGLTVRFVLWSYFVTLLIVVSATDVEQRIIPDEVTVLGVVVGWAASFFFPAFQGETAMRLGLANSVLGTFVGGGVLYLTALIGNRIFKKECMGGGDIKLLAMIGAFLGVKKVLLVCLLAPFLALPLGILGRMLKKEETLPFGPYLALAAVIVLGWGDVIIRALFWM